MIYDKYLTEESLYEKDDIGLKNLFTCARSCSNYLQYQDYGMYGDNLFYDVAIAREYMALSRIDEVELKEAIYELLKTNLYEKLAEYKEIAKQNPNKFYIAIIRTQVLDIYFPNNM